MNLPHCLLMELFVLQCHAMCFELHLHSDGTDLQLNSNSLSLAGCLKKNPSLALIG